MVRLLAPVGMGEVQTYSNRHIRVPDDRVVELSAEDAGPLKRAGWMEAPR
jgi:hypothetical protein